MRNTVRAVYLLGYRGRLSIFCLTVCALSSRDFQVGKKNGGDIRSTRTCTLFVHLILAAITLEPGFSCAFSWSRGFPLDSSSNLQNTCASCKKSLHRVNEVTPEFTRIYLSHLLTTTFLLHLLHHYIFGALPFTWVNCRCMPFQESLSKSSSRSVLRNFP